MFNKVFIEQDIQENPFTQNILSKIKYQEKKVIERYDNIWGRVKKPYLQKRDNLNLFIASKRGDLVKEAPDAYGLGSERHYYFIHAFNCIYECQYCYLQGYFNTPDIVLFVNHHEIIQEMKRLSSKPENKGAWFHAGEYSDSLALGHITGELREYFNFFYEHPEQKLELRTKAVNIRPLLELKPAPNIFVSFTLSSNKGGKAFDFKCPSITHRLNAIQKLVQAGYMIGIHLDPIIYHENFEQGYQELLKELQNILPNKQLGYISIGVVRFTKDVYHEVQKNYPESNIHTQDYIKSFDGKIRYNRPMRKWMLNHVKDICLKAGYTESKIYECMED